MGSIKIDVAGRDPMPGASRLHPAEHVVVKNQVLPAKVGIRQWAADFEFSSAETDLTDAIFRRRLAVACGNVELTPFEVQQLRIMANGDAAFEACRESLGEIGIVLP